MGSREGEVGAGGGEQLKKEVREKLGGGGERKGR